MGNIYRKKTGENYGGKWKNKFMILAPEEGCDDARRGPRMVQKLSWGGFAVESC